MSAKSYHFEEVGNCEMCGDDTATHKILGIRLNKSQGLHPKKKTGVAVTVKKCSNCNLVYASPMPVPFSLQDHYDIPPEQYWQPSYFEWSEQDFLNEIKVLKTLIDVKPGVKALDIGAGLGKSMIALERAGLDAYGLEPSKSFYERAISKMNISPEKLRLGMIEETDYDLSSFDFITFGAVLEHLYHPARCLEKALTWLKPGGIIHMEIPSSKYLIHKLINLYYRLAGTSFVTNLSPMHEPFHLYEFGIESFQKLGERLNFSIAHYNYFVCDVFSLPRFFHPPLKRIMKATGTGMQLSGYLRKIGK